MPFLADTVFDNGLSTLTTNLDRVDICYTQEPTTYTEATSTYSCGNSATTTGSPTAGDTSGRKVTIQAISSGSVTDTQTAGWWAGTNGTDTFYAANALSATQAVTSGNTFSLTAIDIEMLDAVTE